LRSLPSVDDLLGRPAIADATKSAGRAVVTSIIRNVLATLRREFSSANNNGASTRPLAGEISAAAESTPGPSDSPALERRILDEIAKSLALSLRPVINATGVVLHTNLGRAPLSAAALAHVATAAGRYSNLEYDIATGARGKRDTHTSRLIADIVGAEAAIVVNNNAAAVFLILNTLAKGGEAIVSRGELIEIGDGFRIPDIMSESGAILREVGTTNRTRIADYERAINDRTRVILRVHPSNFKISGFTARPTLEELATLARKRKLPLYEDLGSGCLVDLAANGINEPVARESFIAGVGVISFSADKLLGGPQAGIIAGKKKIVDPIRRNPLFRALRVDKLTIAALEVTLQSYRRGALDEIPALRMIRTPAAEIATRAAAFIARLQAAALPKDAAIELVPGHSVIGGGSTPDQSLPTHLIAITSRRHSAQQLESALRQPRASETPRAAAPVSARPSHAIAATPVIARIQNKRIVLDFRTVQPEEESTLADAILAALL